MTRGITGIYAREYGPLDRHVQIGLASGKVLRVAFPNTPEPDARTDHPLLDRIESYLQGTEKDSFDDVQVALTIPTDQRRVLEAARDVPYGTSITTDALARMTPSLDHDDDTDLATVRTALSENPAPIFIPGHRIDDGPSAAPPAVRGRLRSIEGL